MEWDPKDPEIDRGTNCPNCGAEGLHWVYCPSRVPGTAFRVRRTPRLAPISTEMEAEHKAHAAMGENHWFSCYLCDDESED